MPRPTSVQGSKAENSTVREKSDIDLFSALVNFSATENLDSFRCRKKSHLLESCRKKSAETAQAQAHLDARRQGGEQHCCRETVVHKSTRSSISNNFKWNEAQISGKERKLLKRSLSKERGDQQHLETAPLSPANRPCAGLFRTLKKTTCKFALRNAVQPSFFSEGNQSSLIQTAL
jgi:hypothetical protein